MIAGARADVVARLDAAPLEALLPDVGAFPGVVGTRVLKGGVFGEPGSRREVLLSDGSHAFEEALERSPEGFRYLVWGYSSRQASGIDHAVGEFRYADLGGSTRIDWTYGFRLKTNAFPGALGPLGPPLFRLAFLDTAWAQVMRATLARMKTYAESGA